VEVERGLRFELGSSITRSERFVSGRLVRSLGVGMAWLRPVRDGIDLRLRVRGGDLVVWVSLAASAVGRRYLRRAAGSVGEALGHEMRKGFPVAGVTVSTHAQVWDGAVASLASSQLQAASTQVWSWLFGVGSTGSQADDRVFLRCDVCFGVRRDGGNASRNGKRATAAVMRCGYQ
jgi:hypothetical protein